MEFYDENVETYRFSSTTQAALPLIVCWEKISLLFHLQNDVSNNNYHVEKQSDKA